MKILILTIGSRGDVEPYVALGKGLQGAGHTVSICTCSRFQSYITDHGLLYEYMGDGMMELMDSAQGRQLMETATNLWEIIKANIALAKRVAPLQRLVLKESWDAAHRVRPDLIIFHPKAYGGHQVAEKLGIPKILAMPFPLFVASGERPHMGFPQWKIGAWYNKMTYTIVQKLMTMSTHKYITEWRAEQSMPPLSKGFNILRDTSNTPIPTFFCYSHHVSSRPRDWADTIHITGYWFIHQTATWNAPLDLRQFLDDGEPPVYIGFGSMAGRNTQRLTDIVIEAVRKANVRGIIASGGGGLQIDRVPDTIFVINEAPHHWLFPRVAAIVHHGGAGTTAAGLRAGRPMVICPFFGDQPYWGEKIYSLGCGVKPIPQKTLTAEKLAAAIKEVVTNKTMQQQVHKVGESVRREDGVSEACTLIESIVQKRDGLL